MPLYEYKCRECGHQFEVLTGKSVPDGSPVCPSCGSDKCEKQFSTFAAAVAKGGSTPPCGSSGGCGGGFS